MICPFCGQELRFAATAVVWYCRKHGFLSGNEKLWQALIQSQRDLQDKKEELEEFKKHHAMWEQIRNNTILALEKDLQIAKQALERYAKTDDWCYPEEERNPNFDYRRDWLSPKSVLLARKALAQITHDNSEKPNNQEHKD